MLATSIGMTVFLEKDTRMLTRVENTTDVTFITGDQPLINLHSDSGEKPPATLSWYYPISPRLALLLPAAHEEPAFSMATLRAAQVSDLNQRILVASHRQTFAHERSLLDQ